ncbi:MAG TPA: DUF433 domain-containing protein [Pirellulales bacterium]|nr:DUF433 domain-containing protein [Pirellulales bacterium]
MKYMTTPTTTTPPSTASGMPSLADLIVKTPGVCGGQARIAGTRIKVKHVYTWVEQMGMSPLQVVAKYPHLTRAQVHAALAYYWCHQDEIHKDIENEDNLVAELKAKAGPSRIQKTMADQDATDDPFSSR